MKRWLSHLTIVAYLGTLLAGIGCHALNWGISSHPAMYYIVWDMFCGWAAYESRYHVIGEGESGTYYELSPGPWGDIRPYGKLGRRHYDPDGIYCLRMAQNTLRHTDHEPMARLFVIQESWAKKYNLPDHLWAMRHEEPKEKYSYFRVRQITTGDGMILHAQSSWLDYQARIALASNPRLRAEMQRSRPFVAVDGLMAAPETTYTAADGLRPFGTPHGN